MCLVSRIVCVCMCGKISCELNIVQKANTEQSKRKDEEKEPK